MKNSAIFMILIIHCATFIGAPLCIENEKEINAFYSSLREKFLEEYRNCTKDNNLITLDSLVRWKNIQRFIAESPQYSLLLHEYLLHHPETKAVTYPCEVIQWNQRKRKEIQLLEDTLLRKALTHADITIDSMVLSEELFTNEATRFDLKGIRFGMSKKSVKYQLKQLYGYPASDSGTRIVYAEHFPIQDHPFLIRFHFSTQRRLVKYEIEGYKHPPVRLDTVVRKQAWLLKEFLEGNAGLADTVNRIGYFDIKKDVPATLAAWNDPLYSVSVSLCLKNGFYYALLRVEKKEVSRQNN